MALCTGDTNRLRDYAVYSGAARGDAPHSVHRHDYVEIFLDFTGNQTFLVEDRLYSMGPRDLLIINSGEAHAVSENAEGAGCFVEVRPEFLLALCTDQTNLLIWDTGSQRRITLEEREFEELKWLMLRCQNAAAGYGADVLNKAYFVELMVMLSRCIKAQRKAERRSYDRYSELLAPALRFIDSNLQEDFSLQDLADHIGVSKCYLCKIFKNGTGTTVNQYVMSRRINRAKELLQSGKNVTEVSAEAGFNDYSYFIKSFKSATGTTPAKYARSSSFSI